MIALSGTISSQADDEVIYPPDQIIGLWPGRALHPDYRHYAKRKSTITRITWETRPSIEIYNPRSDFDSGSDTEFTSSNAVVILPGGGYTSLAYDLEGTEIAQWLNQAGYTAVILRYTVPSKGSAPLRDLQRAMGVLRHNAEKLRINPASIGLLGFSAGGHLAVKLCVYGNKRIYEPIDEADNENIKPAFVGLVYPAYLTSKNKIDLSDEIEVSASFPPTFLVHTKDDTKYVNGSYAYTKALDEYGVDVESHIFETGGHGFGLRSLTTLEVSKWTELFKFWLSQQLLP